MTSAERRELGRLQVRRCWGGVDRRYRRWDAAQEVRFQHLLKLERTSPPPPVPPSVRRLTGW